MTPDPTAGHKHSAILPLGAIIQRFTVRCPSGGTPRLNIVLNFPTPELYRRYNVPYFGETIGRTANRIAGARINLLNGQSYALSPNDGDGRGNCLHGGASGWGKKVWTGPTAEMRQGREASRYDLLSPDGDEGFPGQVRASVWYLESVEEGEGGEEVSVLEMEYEAELVGGAGVEETVVGMTNHSYFNLSGDPTIESTGVTLPTALHLPVDDKLIPTGAIAPYPGIEANAEFTLGPTEPDIDHCFVLDPADETPPATVPPDTRARPLRLNVAARHAGSRVRLEVHSTEPAFQLYTGRYIDVPEARDDAGRVVSPARVARAGFCVEPSRFVNAVNVDAWRGMVVLRRGQLYGARVVYRAWQEASGE